MEFDDILLDVGDFGRYQWLILLCLCAPVSFFAGIQSFIQLFLAATPSDHWCRVPELAEYNKTIQLFIGIPPHNGTNDYPSESNHSHCRTYKHNYTDFFANISEWSQEDEVSERVFCENGWTYEADIHSVIPEWDLVCRHEGYANLAHFIFTLGCLCSLMTFGVICDFFGRKSALFLCIAIQAVIGTCSAFSPTFPLWCGCRFLIGFTVPASLRIPMIYATELVRPERRELVGFLTGGSYGLGMVALAGFAVIFPEWRLLTLCMSMPEIALLFLWWFIPESPRWLLAQNRGGPLKEFLRYTAKINGRIIGSNTLNKLDLILDHDHQGPQHSGKLTDLFRLPGMRMKTILITFVWFSNISVYLGLSYYSPTLEGKTIYWNYLLSVITEVLAYQAVWLIAEKLGRRLPICMFLISAGIFSILMVALPEKNPQAILAMFLMGKCCVSASFFLTFLYASELFPTVIRGTGIGISATIATLGVCVGPLAIHVGGEDYVAIPLIIFGIFAILGAFAVLFLPETWHHRLPDTMTDGEEFGRCEGGLFSDFRFRAELVKAGIGLSAARAGSEKSRELNKEVLGGLNVEVPDEELVFDHGAHFRTFPQPGPKRQSLSRLNSARGLMSAQDEG